MAIISITITDSVDQTIPGIPNTVSISTNEPAIIFYTLDGTAPTTYSPIYITPISLPQNLLTVVLNIYATNQLDTSAVITKQYNAIVDQIPNAVGDRLPHAAVANVNNNANIDLYPFGSSQPQPNGTYTNPANSGTTVFDQSKPATSNGFDANENPAVFTNQPIDNFKFKQIYSTTNVEGEITAGVGNLPAQTTIVGKQTPVEYGKEISNFADKLFNPRALVIYQDSTNEDPTNPVHLNRPYFSLENQEIVRDGNLLFNSTLDSPSTMGSFVNRHYNPRTNMMTSYYRDNTVNRWIISSFPYQPTTPNVGALSGMVFGRSSENGDGRKVFKWIQGLYRTLI